MFFGNYSYTSGKEANANNINLPKLINAFIKVYETCNLTEASKLLLRTKSSVSKNIKQLEDILGEKLFNRNGRNGLSITKFGESFFFIRSSLKLRVNLFQRSLI